MVWQVHRHINLVFGIYPGKGIQNLWQESNRHDDSVLVLAIVKNEIGTIHQCISSLLTQTRHCKILVSDNLSNDGTFQYLLTVSKENSCFHVIQPNYELSLPSHFKFLLDYADSHFNEIPYRILIGGDDAYLSKNLLEELVVVSDSAKQSSIPVIALPRIRLENVSDPSRSRTLSNMKILNSKSRILRATGLALAPTSFGYYNFVLGLMTTNNFNYWARSWLGLLHETDYAINSKRDTKSEILNSFKLLVGTRVKIVPCVTMLKRQHNRKPGGDRLESLKKPTQLMAFQAKGFKITIKHQFQHSCYLITSIWKYKDTLSIVNLFFGSLGGFMALFINLLYFLYGSASRRFRFFHWSK